MNKIKRNQSKKATKKASKVGAGTISTAKGSNNHFNDDNPNISTTMDDVTTNATLASGISDVVGVATTLDTGPSIVDYNVSIAAACNITLGLKDNPGALVIPAATNDVPIVNRATSDVIGSITTMETKSDTEDQNHLIAATDDCDLYPFDDKKFLSMSRTPSSDTFSESSSFINPKERCEPHQFTYEHLLDVSPLYYSDSENMSCSFSLAERIGSLPTREIDTWERFLGLDQRFDLDHFSPDSVAQQPTPTPTDGSVPTTFQEPLNNQTATAVDSSTIPTADNISQEPLPSQAKFNLADFLTTCPTAIHEVFHRLANHYAMIKPSGINASVTHYATYNAMRDLNFSISMLKEEIHTLCQWMLHLDKNSWKHLHNLKTENVMLSNNKYSLQGHIPQLKRVIDALLTSPEIRNQTAAKFPSVESFDEYVSNLQGADIPFAAYFIMFLRVYDFAQKYLHLINDLKRYRASCCGPTLSHFDLTNLHTLIINLRTAADFLNVRVEHTVVPLPLNMDEQDTVIAQIKESLAVHHAAHDRNLDLTTLLPSEVRNMPWYNHVERVVALQFSTNTDQDLPTYLNEVQKNMYYTNATTNNLRSVIIMVYLSYYSFGTASLKAAVRKVSDDSQPIIYMPLDSHHYPSELDNVRTALHQQRKCKQDHDRPHLTQRMIATVITMAFQDHRHHITRPSKRFREVAQLLMYKPDALHQQLLRLFNHAEFSSSKLYLLLSFDNLYPCDYHVFVYSLLTLFDTLDYHWPHVTDHYAIQLEHDSLTVDVFEQLQPHAQQEFLLFKQAWHQRHQRQRTRLLHVFHDTHVRDCIFPGSDRKVKTQNLLTSALETNYSIPLTDKLIRKVFKASKTLFAFNVTPMSTSNLQVLNDAVSIRSSSTPTTPEYDYHEIGDDAISENSFEIERQRCFYKILTNPQPTPILQPTLDSPTYPPYSPLTQVTSTADQVAASETHFHSMTNCLDSNSDSERNSSITTDNDHDQSSQVNANTFIRNVLQTVPVASESTQHARKRYSLSSINSSNDIFLHQPDDEGEGTQSPSPDLNLDTIETSTKKARHDSEGRQR